MSTHNEQRATPEVEEAMRNLRERVRGHVEATAGTNQFTSWKAIEDEVRQTITTLTTKHQEELEKAVEAEKKRILDELWRLVEWHSEEKNQIFGVVSANTTINALHQARGIVRGDNYVTASQSAPTKTDDQTQP